MQEKLKQNHIETVSVGEEMQEAEALWGVQQRVASKDNGRLYAQKKPN
jgi:hypothetical protein